VAHVRDAVCAKVEMPARVFHVLQVEATGERGLAQIAGAQRALVHRRQLEAVGITRGSYNHRVAAGALHQVLPSVLSVVHPLIEPLAAETAALLYAGDDAVISHDSAAALWGLTSSPAFVALTVVGRHVRARPGLHVHQVAGLDIRDARLHKGFPVTSPARTLIDCAWTPNIGDLLNEARALRLVKDSEIYAAIDRCPGRKGTGPLRALLEGEKDTGYTRSEAERVLKRLVHESGIERPIFNTYVEGVQVDAYWPRLKVIVEVDGYTFHSHWAAFQRDRARDNRLVGAGYIVVRFTWHQLTRKPLLVVAEIVRALSVRIHTNLAAPKPVGSPQT
jgi:very-short-patch-repair endonuclease